MRTTEIIFVRTIVCAIAVLVFYGIGYLFGFEPTFASVAGMIAFNIGIAYGQIIEKERD